jgi:hypothetical protein
MGWCRKDPTHLDGGDCLLDFSRKQFYLINIQEIWEKSGGYR